MMEDKFTEYKSKVTDDLEKEVVAFLNSREGGKIYIGIDKAGDYVGVSNADQVQLVIKDRLRSNIVPSCMGLFDVLVEKSGDKDIIEIVITGGLEKPYYIRKYGMSEKGTYYRSSLWINQTS